MLVFILMPSLLAGCAGTTGVLTDTVGAGVGAIAGNKLGKGNPLLTAAGASAGVLLGDATVRRAEDVDSAALTYAEVKAIASGNPLVIEKAQVDAEVMRLTRLQKQHADHGRHEYKANISDSAAGTIASVEHALESMTDRLLERETDLKQYHKQSADLTKQLEHPFEHEEKLTVTAKRQQEIINALDITTNQASAKMDEDQEQMAEVAEGTPAQKAGQKKAVRPIVAVSV